MSIVSEIAQELGIDERRARDILLERPEITATTDEIGKVLETARLKGLDFNKLRIGRRISTRKEAVEEIMGYIEAHPTWTREEVISYIRYSISLMRRVERKVLPDFF